MDVIFTFFAATYPASVPTTSPPARIAQVKRSEASRILASKSVKTTAMSMPADESRFPFRAVSGLPSILIPRMKIAAETMYAKFMICGFIVICPPFS